MRKFNRVCVLGNQHGLLQYLLLSSIDEINHTFFFFTLRGIPSSVIRKFGKMGTYIHAPLMNRLKGKIKLLDNLIDCFQLFFEYRLYFPIKYPFLLGSDLEYWGQDHVYNFHCILRNHTFCLIEDGLLNYNPFPSEIQISQRFIKFKRILAGKNYGPLLKYAGEEKQCSDIYLTGLSDKGDVLNNPKVKIKSFVEMWNESDMEKRLYINNVFGINADMISTCKDFKHIILTQPFSEIEILTEEEKIDMYQTIVRKIGGKDIVIKPHPLESTDYTKYFPRNFVLNSTAPMQLFSLNGVKIESAYSINTTALCDFPYRINVCVLGSEFYPALYKKRPQWTSDTVKITNKNVEIIKLN